MLLVSSLHVAAAAAMLFGAPEPVRAATFIAVAVAAGAAWARRWSDPLARALWAGWIALGAVVVAGLVAQATNLAGAGVLAVLAILTAAAPAGVAAAPLARGPKLGMVLVLALPLLWSAARRDDLMRPLDGYWWYAPAESLPTDATAPKTAEGWARQTQGAWAEWGAQRLDPREAAAVLIGPTDGPIVLALRGPVGATLWAGKQSTVVRQDVTESAEEGPVPRYQDRGVAALTVPKRLTGGERLELLFSHPDASEVYVIPSTDALWALHNTGALRFTHYYQLLNMVEQLRWAEERWITDVQPPLWTRVLAPVLAVTGGGQPTINLVLITQLWLAGLGALALLRRYAPEAPLPAWFLPGAAVVVHGRLMLDAGSAAMPDSAYAAAMLAALVGPVEGMGLVAQLLRYPATGVVVVGALLAGERQKALRLVGVVVVAAALFGLGGALTGTLPVWLETVAWETGPEHWHGESDPMVLLGRVPGFALAWLAYAGGAPLLAAIAWPRGTRVALGTALIYSLLLATIDHRPTHYFLPLVHLSVVALGCTAASLRNPRVGAALALLGLLGLSIWEVAGPIFD